MTQETYDLLNILAEGLQHGTNANDLLKMFIQAFIESAKHTGPVSSDMRLLIDMLKMDAGWNRAFNFADVNTSSEIAQMVLILQQPDRKGFGLVMIDRPFNGDARMTYCVDDILERIIEVSMKGLYRELRDMGIELGTESMRETLTTLCDGRKMADLDRDIAEEGPQLGVYTDFGRAVEYGKRTKMKYHRTPDSIPGSQQRIVFDDYDRETHDASTEEWEGEHRQHEEPPTELESDRDLMDELSTGHALDDDLESKMGFKPFDQEW